MITKTELTPYFWSKVTGASIVIMAILAIIVEFGIRATLIIPGDATKTASNIIANEGLFRFSIYAYLLILVLDVLASVGFYVVLKPVDKNVALFAAFMRLAYSVVRGVNQVNMFIGLLLLGGTNQESLAMVFFDADPYAFSISLVFFFSIHLFLLGYLVMKSNYIPKIFGILLSLASLAYLLDNSLKILLTNYADYEATILAIIFIPALIGELAFSLWLLLRAKRDSIPET